MASRGRELGQISSDTAFCVTLDELLNLKSVFIFFGGVYVLRVYMDMDMSVHMSVEVMGHNGCFP